MPAIKLSALLFAALALALSACASLDTHLNIPEKPLPAVYKNQDKSTAKTSIASINWRQYFADPLLTKLIETGLANNSDLQIALQRIESSRSSVKLANARLLPQVNLNIGAGIRKFGLYTMDGAGNISTEITPGQTVPIDLPDYTVGIQSSWEVDIWGKLRSQRKAAVAQYLATIEGTNFVISNLVGEIAVQYNELLELDNEIDIISQTLQTSAGGPGCHQSAKRSGAGERIGGTAIQGANLEHAGTGKIYPATD